MTIDTLKGGAEGIVMAMEVQKMQPAAQGQQASEQQGQMNRVSSREEGTNTQSGVAIQGLGENIDVLV